MIGVVAGSAGGRTAAATLAAAWPGEVRVFPGEALRDAWRDCDEVVAFLPVPRVAQVLGAAAGPAVVCVDESMRFAVAVLGDHRAAQRLAYRLTGVLGCAPIGTRTSEEATPLDRYGADLGFTVHDPGLVPHVGAAVLAGDPVALEGADGWPLPALPSNVGPVADAAVGILVTDRAELTCMCHEGWFGNRLVYRPPALVVGIGSCAGTAGDEVGRLIDATLAEGVLAPDAVRCVATVASKADEPGIREAARRRGWEVISWPADVLAGVKVPNPSEAARAGVGTPSVAEAAALHTARSLGRGGDLVVPKRKAPQATAAVARLAAKGRLSVVGIGPGDRDLITPRAVAALRRASRVVGPERTVDLVRDLLRPGTLELDAPDADFVGTAVAEAAGGRAVALVSTRAAVRAQVTALTPGGVDIEFVPGVTTDG